MTQPVQPRTGTKPSTATPKDGRLSGNPGKKPGPKSGAKPKGK